MCRGEGGGGGGGGGGGERKREPCRITTESLLILGFIYRFRPLLACLSSLGLFALVLQILHENRRPFHSFVFHKNETAIGHAVQTPGEKGW